MDWNLLPFRAVNGQPDSQSVGSRREMFALILLAACLVYGSFFLFMPPVVQFALSNKQNLVI
jgi:hypothetical protein